MSRLWISPQYADGQETLECVGTHVAWACRKNLCEAAADFDRVPVAIVYTAAAALVARRAERLLHFVASLPASYHVEVFGYPQYLFQNAQLS